MICAALNAEMKASRLGATGVGIILYKLIRIVNTHVKLRLHVWITISIEMLSIAPQVLVTCLRHVYNAFNPVSIVASGRCMTASLCHPTPAVDFVAPAVPFLTFSKNIF